MWREIGKRIVEGTLVSVGIKVMADKVVPAAAGLSKETWKKVKETKSTGRKKDEVIQDEKVKVRPIRTKIVSTQKSKIYDADYQDTKE
jgi:hypothetical protein